MRPRPLRTGPRRDEGGQLPPYRRVHGLSRALIARHVTSGHMSRPALTLRGVWLWMCVCGVWQRTPKKVRALASADAAAVHAGEAHSVVTTSSGLVFTFGQGHRGQLGHGDLQSRSHPTCTSIGRTAVRMQDATPSTDWSRSMLLA